MSEQTHTTRLQSYTSEKPSNAFIVIHLYLAKLFYHADVINTWYDSVTCVSRFEHYCKISYFSISNTIDEYEAGIKSKWRIFWIAVSMLILFIQGVRATLIAVWKDNLWIRYMLCDMTYLLGNTRLITTFIVVSIATVSLLKISGNYYEWLNKFEFVNLLNIIGKNW